MMSNETTWECEKCGIYNITEGIITDGKMYCIVCGKKIKNGFKK